MTDHLYYTQKELAAEFRVCQATVIKWRELGYLEYFRPPTSRRVLYSRASVERFRKTFTYREEVMPELKLNGRCNRRVAPDKNWSL